MGIQALAATGLGGLACRHVEFDAGHAVAAHRGAKRYQFLFAQCEQRHCSLLRLCGCPFERSVSLELRDDLVGHLARNGLAFLFRDVFH